MTSLSSTPEDYRRDDSAPDRPPPRNGTTLIRALVVDDEPLGRERVRSLLEAAPDVEVIGEAGDGEEAAQMIRELRPDLVFLDVQMPEMDGLEVLRRIGAAEMPRVVFVTAYEQFAVRAFEAAALDYLLKPFDDERFERALDRARESLAGGQGGGGELEERLAALLARVSAGRGGEPEFPERFMVRVGQQFHFVKTDEIDWIEAADNYLKLHVAKRAYMLRETMGGMEARLDPRRFLRIHRSTMVNIDRIQAMEVWSQTEYLVILKDGTRLTSSRGYRDRVRAFLGR